MWNESLFEGFQRNSFFRGSEVWKLKEVGVQPENRSDGGASDVTYDNFPGRSGFWLAYTWKKEGPSLGESEPRRSDDSFEWIRDSKKSTALALISTSSVACCKLQQETITNSRERTRAEDTQKRQHSEVTSAKHVLLAAILWSRRYYWREQQ